MKIFFRFTFFYLTLFLLTFRISYATHIVGGELEMRHITNNDYLFNLIMYFDAVNGNPGAIDPTVSVHIFAKGSNTLIQTIQLPRVSDALVPYTNPACARGDLTTRRIGYSLRLTLNPNTYASAQGYYMVWERCCRNGIINNITNPGNAGQTFYAEFPPLIRNGVRFINSTPQLFPPLSDYACVNQNFFFDFRGTDPDGDQLVYSMAHPINGSSSSQDPSPSLPVSAPYSLVNFVNGISVANMVPGSPPLNISSSGIVTMNASRTGLHVFAVKCEEFRNGVKIGEVRRDFQLLVLDCQTANAPNVQVQNPNAAGSFLTSRDTIVINASDASSCTNLEIKDPNRNTQIKVRINPINFSSLSGVLTTTSGTLNGAGDVLRVPICFPFCPTISPTTYTMDVIVEDNSCAVPLLDTARVNVRIVNNTNQRPQVTTSLTSLIGTQYSAEVVVGKTLNFNVLGDDPNKDFITLSGVGQGFTLSSVGMNFATLAGNPKLTAPFSWSPPCNLLAPNEAQKDFIVKFSVIDRRRCETPQNNEITVKITVKNALNANKKPIISTSLKYDTLQKLYYDTVFVKSNIKFDVIGDDVDSDSVRLTFAGVGFDAANFGATFPSVVGLPKQTGKFSWTPPCETVNSKLNPKGKAYDFIFTARDLVACNGSLFDTTRVRIFVKPLTNRKPSITTSLKFDAATKTYYDTVYVKSQLNFDVLGDDIDKDNVTLSYQGIGFNLEGLGTTLTNRTGKPILTGKFNWVVPCSAVEPTNFAGKVYNFNFMVNDVPPCPDSFADTVKVKIFVKPVFNRKPTITASLPLNTITKIYYDSVKVGGTFRFNVIGDDFEKDIVELSMEGLNNINPTSLGMIFSSRRGNAPQIGVFTWKTACLNLDDTLKSKDYNLRFVVKDFDQCGNSKYDTLKVRLRVLPNTDFNNEPITSTNIGTAKYDAITKTYTDTVLMKTMYRMDVLADDKNLDSLQLRGNGIGFNFADFKMQFQTLNGRPILKSPFVWQPTCDMLPPNQATKLFTMRFITQDFRECQRSKFDTIIVKLVLKANPADNTAPVTTATNLTLSARKTYSRTITAGDTLNFKTIVNDAEKDSVSISATGLTDGMSFTGIKALSPLERDFKWITNCALLGGVIAPKDYSLTFFVRDYKGCGVPKFDTIKVNLRLVPLPNPNPPRLSFTDSATYLRNNVATANKREFNKTVKPNEVINLDFTSIDLDKDIVIIEAIGEGFNLADFGMKFTNVRGIAPQKTKFEWTPDCETLKRRQDFRVRFITQDQVVCRVTKADTIYINFKIEDVAAGRDFKDYNVFTPNGDGKNDKFSLDIPNDNCVDTFIKIEIYNRWGKLVYESNDRNFAWEGSGFPAGLYYYYVQFKNKQYKNSVTLLRNE